MVVLREGHLITEGTLADVIAMAGSRGHTVQVRPEEIERAVQIIATLGVGDVTVVGSDIVTQRQLDDPSRITYALGIQGINLRGLQTSHASLEDAFLEITRTEAI